MPEARTRRRGTELEKAILEAAWAELNDAGYARFTIEAVATRAGTSKPVIYRRWANRAELVLAAWGNQAPMRQPSADTGELRGDLIVLFTKIARRVDGMMNEMIAGVMTEAFHHPEVAGLLRDRLRNAPFGNVVETVVQRAVDRGEHPPVAMTRLAGLLPLTLIRNEALVHSGDPIADEVIAALVDEIYLPLLRGLARD
ncbi:TetR/AcrR family transcriptional regulator [Umezawaea sp. Da 62-37]|uniref:TetR/AcrR family transcriptional regulator n=1 Tax=Umezawaea sp. Da 62-37 TaxID=3075927 RepID=UPI0028F6FB6F|nr:TetR/AcrR family transcriptional regulator [Umezawaea sp. Da 62-37]WNV86916.1 TetR/AcrR family transcriptional regulator [Umezawaea sp. Da 62-37]